MSKEKEGWREVRLGEDVVVRVRGRERGSDTKERRSRDYESHNENYLILVFLFSLLSSSSDQRIHPTLVLTRAEQRKTK